MYTTSYIKEDLDTHFDVELSREHWKSIDKFDDETRRELMDVLNDTLMTRVKLFNRFGSTKRGPILETYLNMELQEFIVEMINVWELERG